MLLAPDEPPPFEVVPASPASRFVIVCDHAGRRVPRALESLGLPASEFERHIAWDLGVAGLGRKLARALDATLILQPYSRLVIDCNRRPTRPDSIATSSEDTLVPGNLAVSAAAALERSSEIFEPYHARVREELDARRAEGRATTLVLLHSFTPVYRGVARPWHAGVLYLRDARLALPMLAELRAQPGLVVGENEPYAASELTDYGIVEHGEGRGLLHVELEVRQDLLSDEAGQSAWSERLARALEAVSPSGATLRSPE
ncbi:MAG TPA: N-formylglutamate amidohydrolase [Polyangiaceae bacterium]|nr:N-formylglutamate amidohydrolase [Polyangiaceae bacterium]